MLLKIVFFSPRIVAHAFSYSSQEAESGKSL